MPTYQYACTACDHRLEAVQSFADDPLTQCPVCEGGLRKLFGSVGIVFKGSGFYRTDSRAAANGKAASEGDRGATGDKGGEKGTKDKTPVEAGAASGSSSSSGSSGSGSSSSGSSSSGSGSGSSGSSTSSATSGS